MKPPLPSVATKPLSIPVELMDRCPLNPRIISAAEASEIGESLRKKGQVVRIEVRPSPTEAGRYELVDGERRWRGARMEKLAMLEANVGDWTDEQVLQFIWISGTEQRRLSVLEEARWARGALGQPGATLESVGALIDVDHAVLSKRLCLLELDAATQEAVQDGTLPWTTAYALAMVPTETARAAACRRCLHPDDEQGPMTYRETVEMIRRDYARSLKGLAWKLDETFPEVEAAGACASCRYRVGNNAEEYGQMKMKGADWCMHTECFVKKQAAIRARIVAKEAGKVALSAEDNALIFKPGSEEPQAVSGYAIAARPIPPDLVKDEVTANGAPSFADVSPAAPIYVGTDGTGRCVDLVKIDEAIAGTKEPEIFRADVVARYGCRDNGKDQSHEGSDGGRVVTPSIAGASPTPEPTKGSLAGSQSSEKKAEKRAATELAKKLSACVKWMTQLDGALVEPEKPKGYDYILASLLWEHMLRSVPDEDAMLVVRAVSAEVPAKGQTGKSALAEYVSGLGGAEELGRIVIHLMIAGTLRVQGPEAKWVAEWHRCLVLSLEKTGKGIAAPGAPAPAMSDAEREKFTQITKAHAAGMVVREIARSYDMPLEEVCGALGVPVPEKDDTAEIAKIRQNVEALFTRSGTTAPAAKDAMAKLACKCRLGEITTLAQWQALERQQQRIADANAKKLANPSVAKPDEQT